MLLRTSLGLVTLLSTFAIQAEAQALQLSREVPSCRPAPGRPLPAAYYRAQVGREFKWVQSVSAAEVAVGGPGWERFDGSGLHDWFNFYKVDIDNDGVCDWFLTMQAPESSGGDHDSLNTLYLSRGQVWKRIGASIPGDKPDVLGLGKSLSEQSAYLFGENVGVVHDKAARVNYIVTAFYKRSTQQEGHPGYRIFVWDSTIGSLRLLDKWQSGSAAAQVYAFFKSDGAWLPHAAREGTDSYRYDPEMEALEVHQACDPASSWRSAPDLYGAVPAGLLLKCPR